MNRRELTDLTSKLKLSPGSTQLLGHLHSCTDNLTHEIHMNHGNAEALVLLVRCNCDECLGIVASYLVLVESVAGSPPLFGLEPSAKGAH